MKIFPQQKIRINIRAAFILMTIFSGLTSSVLGQTQLYFQNFGTGTSFPIGWSAANNGTWTINTANSSTTPTFSGGSNLASGSSNAERTVTYSNNLSTAGYSNITIFWAARRTNANNVTCEWSPDGNTWNSLSFTDVNNNSTWEWINSGIRIALPAGASGASDLSIRWSYDSNGTAGRYRIDDFSVEGCPLPAQPSPITGSTAPCQTSSQTYSVTNISGVTYNWSFPAGWIQTGGSTTNSITVTVGAVSGNITVIPSNICGNGNPRTLAVAVSPVPAQPSTITGNNNPFEGFSETYSVTNVPGVTFNWTFPTGWLQTGGGTTNSVTVTVGSVSGNVTVTPSNACGNGTARNLAVTVTSCVVTSFPWTETFEGTFLPSCWSKIVSTSNDITRSNQQNHTPGGTFSARFSSLLNSTNYNQYLFTPPIQVTAGYTDLSFWSRKSTTDAELLEWGVATTSNPEDFTWASVNLSSNQWNETIVNLSSYLGQNIIIGFHYYGDHFRYVYLDDVSVRTHIPVPGLWTGNVSTDWNTSGNWDNNIVPSGITQVTIPASATNWPAYTGNMTIGTTCSNLTMYGSSELTVTGNLAISNNRTFTCTANSIIHIGGNFTRTGTFNTGSGTVDFYGSTTSTISGSVASWVIFSDDFESNKGWNLIGEFQRGTPQGLGGSTGNADPTSAYSGSNVLGVDLTGLGTYHGDYERNLGNRAYQAISPTINCSGYTNIVLNFRRWLGIQRQDRAYIDISNNDGATWTQIWRNNNTINQSTWNLQTINISTYANNQSQVKIRFCIGTTNNTRQYCGWNIDDVQITAQISSGVISFYNLVDSKSNAELISNSYVNVINNTDVKPGAWLTNGTDQALNIGGNVLFEANATGMASYIDNGGTTVSGTTNVQQYVTSQRWHLVGSPLTDATINTYYDIYLKYYNEPSNTWTYMVTPTTIPMNVGQGYAAWASDQYTGTTTVTFTTSTGQLNDSEITIDTLDYTVGAPSAGYNLLGNPYPCALNWNSNWQLTNMSGWMQIYDNGVYRGYNINGSSINGGTPIIPSTQGFWVVALGPDASITMPRSERVHSGQAFYKQSVAQDFPTVSLTSEINGMQDETQVSFLNEASMGFDGFYDLNKFDNVDEAPTLYTINEGVNYAVNFVPDNFKDMKIPVGFKTGEEGVYKITSSVLANFPGDVNIYLEDINENQIIELYENSDYEFSYSPLDDPHRFNLLFKDTAFGEEELVTSQINIYSFNNIVYIQMPEAQIGEIHIYDLMGREVISSSSSGESVNTFEINTGTGYYLVKVQTDNSFVTEKVFIR